MKTKSLQEWVIFVRMDVFSEIANIMLSVL